VEEKRKRIPKRGEGGKGQEWKLWKGERKEAGGIGGRGSSSCGEGKGIMKRGR
jgi:hypothetical protein